MQHFFVRTNYKASGAFFVCTVNWTTTVVDDLGITPFETLNGTVASTSETTALRGISIPYEQPGSWSERRHIEFDVTGTTGPTSFSVYEMSGGVIQKNLWDKNDCADGDRIAVRQDEDGNMAGWVNDVLDAISMMDNPNNDIAMVFENDDGASNFSTMTVESFGDGSDHTITATDTDDWCGNSQR